MKYLNFGVMPYEIADNELAVISQLTKKSPSVDLFLFKSKRILVHVEDINTGIVYLYDSTLKNSEDKLNTNQNQNKLEDNIEEEDIDFDLSDDLEDYNLDEDFILEDITLIDEQPKQDISEVENECLRVRLDRNILDILVLFKRGDIKVEGNDVTLTSKDTVVKFLRHDSYTTIEDMKHYMAITDYEYVDITSIAPITKALNIVEKSVFKHFICLDRNELYSFTDSIHMSLNIKSTVKNTYIFNNTQIKVLSLTTIDNALLLKGSNTLIITPMPKINEIPNIAKSIDFKKLEKLFQLDKIAKMKLNLFSKYRENPIVNITPTQAGILVESSLITSLIPVRSVKSNPLKVDIDMLLMAIACADKKEVNVSALKITENMGVVVVDGNIKVIIKQEV